MIDRIDKRPTIDKISSMRENYPPSVYEEEISLPLSQAPPPIACHRVSLDGVCYPCSIMKDVITSF